jgi:hypothetical protein
MGNCQRLHAYLQKSIGETEKGYINKTILGNKTEFVENRQLQTQVRCRDQHMCKRGQK